MGKITVTINNLKTKKMKSKFWKKLEDIFAESVGGFYDVRHGKTVKYRVKLIYKTATEKQLAEIMKIDGVVKVKNISDENAILFKTRYVNCVCIYLSKRISEIK